MNDEVDGVIAAWRRERPDFDVEPMHVLSRVTRLARRLDAVRAQAFTVGSLESWEFDVLAALRRAGEPHRLSPGKLVTATAVTSGTMTNRIDRLAQRGLVLRQAHPEDRRGVQVTLTAAGLDAVDAAMAALLAAEAALLESVPLAERTTLANLLRAVFLALN